MRTLNEGIIMNINRREFLSHTIKASLGLSTLSLLPNSIQKALAIPANNESGTIKDVKHVVILMQENRSFDHYFGSHKGVRGFSDRFTIPTENKDNNIFIQSYNVKKLLEAQTPKIPFRIVKSVADALLKISPDSKFIHFVPTYMDADKVNAQRAPGLFHTWPDSMEAWNNGKITDWPSAKGSPHSMGFLKEKEIPFQTALANAFTLCDAYHCSLQGGTAPNRSFLMSGTNGPTGNNSAFVVNLWDAIPKQYAFDEVNQQKISKHGYEWKTYAEALEENGVTWKSYQNMPTEWGNNMLGAFKAFLNENLKIDSDHPNQNLKVFSDKENILLAPYDEKFNEKYPLYKGIANTLPGNNPEEYIDAFRKDIREGKLPQVSWINAPKKYCEHPSTSSPIQGGWFVQEILNALTENPDVWSKTAFLVMFDENDGYFDHVPPPAPPSFNNKTNSYAGKSTLSANDMSYEYYTHNLQANAQSEQPNDQGYRGQPYGPGPRVPCFIISPWSKGGIINSQVFDHTSVLMFLEKCFDVKAENISPFRRAICGDLTSAFNFKNPNWQNVPLFRASPNRPTTDEIANNQSAKYFYPFNLITHPLELRKIAFPTVPKQDKGICLSNALPYELHTSGERQSDGSFKLKFSNTGTQGAVLHVYDKKNLSGIPNRYVLEAGKQLEDIWYNNKKEYDLWVLGPNGFHRHFTEKLSETLNRKISPEIRICYDLKNEAILLEVINNSNIPLVFNLKSNAYNLFEIKGFKLEANTTHKTPALSLKDYYNWYDFTVTVNEAPSFTRRFAGRIETGRILCTDPAMVTADKVEFDNFKNKNVQTSNTFISNTSDAVCK